LVTESPEFVVALYKFVFNEDARKLLLRVFEVLDLRNALEELQLLLELLGFGSLFVVQLLLDLVDMVLHQLLVGVLGFVVDLLSKPRHLIKRILVLQEVTVADFSDAAESNHAWLRVRVRQVDLRDSLLRQDVAESFARRRHHFRRLDA